MTETTLKQSLENFLASQDFAEAVISSTLASFSGSSFTVELFENGTYRVIWTQSIGNRYESSGQLLTVPTLSDEDYRDLCEVAGSTDKDALVKELRITDGWLEAIANEMRDGFEESYV